MPRSQHDDIPHEVWVQASLKVEKQRLAAERKGTPVYRGFIRYFPDAVLAVARLSFIGNKQHNPDSEMFWDRSKSGDELDALMRHLIDAGKVDDDGVLHDTKVAWRAMANLQKVLEQQKLCEKK